MDEQTKTTSAARSPKATRKSGGRAGRVAARAPSAPQIQPAPPGQTGGQYKPLSDSQLQRILDASFDILANIGLGTVPDALQELALARGAHLNAAGRLCYPRALVEEVIDGACKQFTLFGRDQKHDVNVGGDRVFYGTGGAAVQTRNLSTGTYRASTLRDVYDFARVADACENIAWFTRCCIGTDIPDPHTLEVNTAYAMLRGTTKPLGMSFTEASTVGPVIEMFDLALGRPGAFAERPFCKAHISPIISPLRYGEDAVEVAAACIEHNVPINAIIAAQAGATAPATLAGMLAQSHAETLAALMLVNLLKPGYPMIFSNWPFVVDLRTGSFAGSGGEISMMNAAAAQLSNHLGLPSGVACSMSDAKAVDAQYGQEKALSALAAGLAGGNMIYESAGMTASLLGVSFEGMVADNELISLVQRILRGAEVTDEMLGIDGIERAVLGAGHFLGSDQTLAAMQRDYYYPALSDRSAPAVWEEGGSQTLEDRARAKAQELLATPDRQLLSADADQSIRDRFEILLALG